MTYLLIVLSGLVGLCQLITTVYADHRILGSLDDLNLNIESQFIKLTDQPIIEAPNKCSGTLEIFTGVQFSTASFDLNCAAAKCKHSRELTTSTLQRAIAGFPNAAGSTLIYSVTASNNQVVSNSICNGTDYQPHEINFSVSDLFYNYSAKIINNNDYIVKRTFDHLGSANLTINGTLVASISADKSLYPIEESKQCKLGEVCQFNPKALSNLPYIGNDYLRFYYTVPTFIIFLAPISNSIANVCSSNDYIYVSNELKLCKQGINPLGLCLGNNVLTQIAPISQYENSFCEVPTNSPTRTPTSAGFKANFSNNIATISLLIFSILFSLHYL